MALPAFETNLNIIQQLEDEPNDVGGLTAAELKAKFDEAGLTIQTWINETLLPAMIAANLAFAKTTDIPAETVQAAIENIQEQLKQATVGAVPNGSVNYIKLATDVTAILTKLREDMTQAEADITKLKNRPIVISPATQDANGLMSSTDKKKLDGIAAGATRVLVNNELSATSGDAIMNKVVYAAVQSLTTALSGKAPTDHTHVMANITDLSIDAAPAKNSGNPISSGGVFSALQNFKTATQFTGTLLATGWSEDSHGYQAQTITITGLKASYDVDPQWDVVLSGTDPDADAALLEGFALIHNYVTGANSLTAQCIGSAPTVNVPVKVVVFG